jgi:hypothetical protein
MRRSVKEPRGDDSCAKHQNGAGEKHRVQAFPPGERAQRRAAETESHIKEYGVGAHSDAPALVWSLAHGFNAKAWVDQRVPKAG